MDKPRRMDRPRRAPLLDHVPLFERQKLRDGECSTGRLKKRVSDKDGCSVYGEAQKGSGGRVLPVYHLPHGTPMRPIDVAVNRQGGGFAVRITPKSPTARKDLVRKLQNGMPMDSFVQPNLPPKGPKPSAIRNSYGDQRHESTKNVNFSRKRELADLNHPSEKVNSWSKYIKRSSSSKCESLSEFDAKLPSCSLDSLASIGVAKTNETKARIEVKEMIQKFRAICDELLMEGIGKGGLRVDLRAAKIFKSKFACIKGQTVGTIPGVEIGDEFCCRMELNILGLHSPPQAGIDSVWQGRLRIATSVVASGKYADDMSDPNVLIYCGHGGNVVGCEDQAEDQKLEKGNLALKNSIAVKNSVRVIRGIKKLQGSEVVLNYTYYGLYKVQSYWTEKGEHGKMVYKFQLNRVPGQPSPTRVQKLGKD